MSAATLAEGGQHGSSSGRAPAGHGVARLVERERLPSSRLRRRALARRGPADVHGGDGRAALLRAPPGSGNITGLGPVERQRPRERRRGVHRPIRRVLLQVHEPRVLGDLLPVGHLGNSRFSTSRGASSKTPAPRERERILGDALPLRVVLEDLAHGRALLDPHDRHLARLRRGRRAGGGTRRGLSLIHI